MRYGIDFTINKNGTLEFAENIKAPRPAIRKFKDAAKVLYPYQKVEPDKTPIYYMYRGVYRQGDEQVFRENNIRHDITVLLPGFMGQEYIKTVGHFHPKKPGSEETYPEYYEVLYGEALYLFQKNTPDGDVEETFIVTARQGDKVYIDPGYGHVSINPGTTHLVMANLVADTFKSDYKPIERKKGAAYFYIKNNLGEHEFVPNPNYKNYPELKLIPAEEKDQPIEIPEGKTLYKAFLEDPQKFSFLKEKKIKKPG
ncbi:MAG TPA: glucose-6-phosphate isomerase [Peptococcaceae bacterium]|nr:MAG: Glucose-6-phosphate isomerase [Clostridia bacterium 41_269]HBT20360.1 glucose-6-phosphate isomerase [Peptococcaceae bacterium]